jgi:2'-5' RNA ligase
VPIRLGRPFVLYGGSDARLIAAPVSDGASDLQELTEDIARAFAKTMTVGFEPTRSLHVTLARFRRGTRRQDVTPVERTLATSDDRLLIHDHTIARVQLMASDLTSSGPRYRALADAPLGR